MGRLCWIFQADPVQSRGPLEEGQSQRRSADNGSRGEGTEREGFDDAILLL